MSKMKTMITLALVALGITAARAAEPRTPDYTTADGKDWLYNHAIAGKAYAGEAVETGVDLFYVYPTIAGGEEIAINGFRDIDDATMRSTELSRSTAAGAFAETGRCFADMTHVYAPFYRQLTLGAANDISTNALGEVVADANARYVKTISQGPSYADVTNALTTYFAKWNNGRKLVLAGHSQGSAHLRLLMRDYFTLPENRDKAKQVICSYQVGYGMSAAEMADITEKTGITFAEKADDTGVIVSYNTMGEGSSGSSTLLPPDTIAINPLSWTRSTELAEKDLNLGALTNALGTADIIVPGLYGAQVADTGFNRGEVVVCKELNGEVLPPSIFGTGSLHGHDYGAYWENLRANVYDRGGNLAGLCKLCTTNFPAHLCVSNATINLIGKSAFDVDPVAGTVWIPTNGLESANVTLVAEKGYRIMVAGTEYPFVPGTVTSSELQADGEFLIDSNFLSLLSVEWIQRKPDYADKTGKDWLLNHDIPSKRYAGEPAADPGVDLFYFYPTSVYISDDHVVDGVCDIDDPVLRGPNGATNSWNSSAKVFGDFTHVYAPYYRQTPSDVEIPIGEKPNANAEMRQYWYKRAPYEDVTNALTHYFTEINPNGERPFIFAGHSHGSGMLSLVMEHFFEDHPEWLGNMVACYAIGWGVSKDWEAKLNDDLDMYVATNATDAGVYVFWNTYGPNTNATECILYPDPAKSAAGVNPITWTREKDAYAPASLNLGAWTADDSGAVRPGLYDASNNVANGTLICTSKDVESKYLPPLRMFGEHSLHGWEYKLYWENLRANALQRIKTLNARRLVDDYAQIPLAGTPIDYANPYNWVTNTGTTKPLDVFYVYPTTMLEGDSTIVPVTDAMKAMAYSGSYVSAASAFASYANVFMPAYRQMHMTVPASALYPDPRDFIDFSKGQTPRTDIFAALDYYFTNLNAGVQRPYILASHSQGSCMLKQAFEDYFRSNDTRKGYLKKMVATYGLGYSFAQKWFDYFYEDKALGFATNETDTAVVISWNTEGPNAQGRSFVIEDGALAINPMNWTTKVDVWSETVPDAMIQERTATNYAYVAGTYALVTTNLTNYLDPSMGMGEKSLHGYDWKLWYDPIKANGFTRYVAFADLKPVSTNSIPTVADTTWKVTVDGQEAVKSPVDGTYYVAADAKNVQLVYTINPEKAAANFVFQESGETTAFFPLSYVEKEGQWVQPQPVEDILAATKVIYNQRKPDYTQAKDWILNHYLKPDEARDLAGEPSQDSGVDLVYIYGTVAMTNAETTVDGFADIEDPQMRGDEATHTGGVWGMIPGSVKAFSDYTRVYMPFYRQMTLCGATNVMAKVGMNDANQAFAKALHDGVAYEDVEAALNAYFEKWNEGRPFILAGCSQGAAMLRNMVQYYFTQNPDKLDKLVACYGIAFGVTKEWAEMIENDTDGKIHFATNATERGVYISWNTVGPDSTAIPNGLVPPGAISINPLTWTTEATPADVDKNYGALTNAATGAVVAHLYDATVDTVNGVVVSTNLPASDYVKGLVWFGDKSLHTWELPAWWENIRDNAYVRIETATGKRPCCGTPNDYSKPENWMVRGEKVGGESRWRVEGEVKPVDVFFLYPTTDTGKTPNLVAEIDDAMKATAWDAYQQDTMGFWSYANMYAPYYRQASFLGLQAQAGVGGLKNFCSTHVVKTDVFAALDYYFTNLNANAARPYILAGHSQGSCNIKLIFEEYLKDHPTYKKNLVAAYAMGFAVESSWCKKAGVDFAEGESDTGVILTWNCEGPDAVHGPVNFLTEPDDGQAINPLNWKTDDTYADIGLNLGSVVTNAAGEYVWGKGNADAQLSPKAGSAYGFRPGALVVTNTTAAYSPEVLGYQSYHGYDGAFFQRNVGNNGFTRYAAFAGLAEVKTNDVPKAADATWKVKVKGEGGQWTEAVVSPVDGKYYAPTDAQEVKLVYTLDPEKAAEGYRFANGETTTSFAMKLEGGAWVSTATKAEIEAATKIGKSTLQLGVVAQRYPWDGKVDVNYRTVCWQKEGAFGAVEITCGDVVVTNALNIFKSGEGVQVIDLKSLFGEEMGKAQFKAIVSTQPTGFAEVTKLPEGAFPKEIVDEAYELKAMDTVEGSVSPYASWDADLYISFDRAIAENTVKVAGQWGVFPWVPFELPAMKAGEEIAFRKDVTPYEKSASWNYCCKTIQTISSGVKNLSADNTGAKMKVVLRLTSNEDPTKTIDITTIETTLVEPAAAE